MQHTDKPGQAARKRTPTRRAATKGTNKIQQYETTDTQQTTSSKQHWQQEQQQQSLFVMFSLRGRTATSLNSSSTAKSARSECRSYKANMKSLHDKASQPWPMLHLYCSSEDTKIAIQQSKLFEHVWTFSLQSLRLFKLYLFILYFISIHWTLP